MAETILETIGLTKSFGGVVAVDNVNFKLRSRELRCLIGPNGAGKSTFFKCLTGLIKPTEGEIILKSEDITRHHPHEIARMGVGIKTQVPNLMDRLDVYHNIWLAAHRHDRLHAQEDTQNVLDRLGLERVARTPAGRLSHGERQRVELGVVMAARPWLILLDEPAAGLTGGEVESMAALIGEINRTAALVVVEHDMKFIRAIARTVTMFYRGKILIEADVDAVLADQRVRDVYLGKKAH